METLKPKEVVFRGGFLARLSFQPVVLFCDGDIQEYYGLTIHCVGEFQVPVT